MRSPVRDSMSACRMLLVMTHEQPCPLCEATSGANQEIAVCGNCHAGLYASGALPMRVTGEFQAVTGPALGGPAPGGVGNRSEAACCWCNKGPDAVRKMLSRGDYHICNECVALCADILQMELGDDYGNA